MKKIITFIPLGIGISAAIIYILNVIQFKIINNSTTLIQILSMLKVYLFISIGGFVVYFLIKLLDLIVKKKSINPDKFTSEEFEPFEKDILKNDGRDNKENGDVKEPKKYIPNYDYVPMYHAEIKQDNIKELKLDDNEISLKRLSKNEEKKVNMEKKSGITNKYCTFCGNILNSCDLYCSYCGSKVNKIKINPIIKNVINILEIVILLLIIYFSLNMLFDYKENKDPNFESPFKISMTK